MGKEKVYLVVHKGNPDVQGMHIKMYAMSTVMRFVAKETGATLMEDSKTLLMIADRDKVGDTEWVRNNVMRYVDILNVSTTDQAEAKANVLAERLHAHPDHKGKVGYGLVRRYMQEFYLTDRAASVFGVEVG